LSIFALDRHSELRASNSEVFGYCLGPARLVAHGLSPVLTELHLVTSNLLPSRAKQLIPL